MDGENLYKKLGNRFYALAVMTIIDYLSSFLGLSIYLSIVVFVIQVLIIINAKKASRQYNQPALNIFGNFMILIIITGFALTGILFAQSFQIAFAVLQAQITTLDISPIVLTEVIVGIFSSVLEFLAWYAMFMYFTASKLGGQKKKGTLASSIVAIAMIIAICQAILITVPEALMKSVIDLKTGVITTTGSTGLYVSMNTIISSIVTCLEVLAYFMIGASFVALNRFYSITSEPNLPISPSEHQLTNLTAGHLHRTTENAIDRCPYCKATILPQTNDPGAKIRFCPSCGAQLPSMDEN